MSRAETQALAGAAILMLLQATPWPPVLEYRAALAWQEPWRLLSAHVVHLNWTHALVNAASWFVLARLFAPELDGHRHLVTLATSALTISLALVFLYPGIAWYRGASGILHAMFFAGAVQWCGHAWRARHAWRSLWLPALLLLGGTLKVVLEQPADGVLPTAAWLGAAVVTQAHWLGAVSGVALGMFWLARESSSAPRQASAAQ